METGLRDWDSKGVLRIGASITIGSQFLPNYVKAFSELCPGLDVRVTVDQSERLEQKILANELDCALIEGIAHDPNIVSEAYMEDHLSVICGIPRENSGRHRQKSYKTAPKILRIGDTISFINSVLFV